MPRRFLSAAAALLAVSGAVLAGCTGKTPETPHPAVSGPDPLASASFRPDLGPPGAVLTQRGDDTRLGWYAHEARLTAASVGGGHFGKVASFPVDGKVYAQPLYIPGPPNVLIVATEH